MSDSVRPHRWQPTRLPRPWDSPGKNTGVGCRFLLQCLKVKSEREVAQSCPTLSDPVDCSPPGSSVHGTFQARGLEWVPSPSPSCSRLGHKNTGPKSVLLTRDTLPLVLLPWKKTVQDVKMMLVANISLMLSYSFYRFPFVGQSVAGAQSGDGQTLLPQAAAQVLPPVASHSRTLVPFPVCLTRLHSEATSRKQWES